MDTHSLGRMPLRPCNHTVAGEGPAIPRPLDLTCAGTADPVMSRDQAGLPLYRDDDGRPSSRAIRVPLLGNAQFEVEC